MQECNKICSKSASIKHANDAGELVAITTDANLREAIAALPRHTPPTAPHSRKLSLLAPLKTLAIQLSRTVVNVKCIGASTIIRPFEGVDFTVSVETFKEMIRLELGIPKASKPANRALGIPNCSLQIVCKGSLLDDDETLADYNIGNGDEVMLVVSVSPLAVHRGEICAGKRYPIMCDVSGMHPILGNRYHKMGEDYDLCETAFNNLAEADRALYEVITGHGATPTRYVDVGASLSAFVGISCGDTPSESQCILMKFPGSFSKLVSKIRELYPVIDSSVLNAHNGADGKAINVDPDFYPVAVTTVVNNEKHVVDSDLALQRIIKGLPPRKDDASYVYYLPSDSATDSTKLVWSETRSRYNHWIAPVKAMQVELRQRRRALVVGNNYRGEEGSLKSCFNDADEMEKALNAIGFYVDKRHDLNFDGCMAALGQLRDAAGKGDTVLFYFSGHGASIGGIQYFVPINMKPARGCSTADQFSEHYNKCAVSVPTILVMLSQNGADFKFLIADACRSRSINDAAVHTAVKGAPMPRAIAAAANPPAGAAAAKLGNGDDAKGGPQTLAALNENEEALNTCEMYSSGDATASYAGGSKEMSVFTKELVPLLTTPHLELSALDKKLRLEVFNSSVHTTLTEVKRKKMVPQTMLKMIGDFYFAGEAPH